VSECAKDWIDILQASLTPITAIIGLYIAWRNYQLDKRKRTDGLFDRRFKLYERIKGCWDYAYNEQTPADGPPLEEEDLYNLSEEARFLFDDEISQNIMSFATPRKQNLIWGDFHNFVKSFQKYLKFED